MHQLRCKREDQIIFCDRLYMSVVKHFSEGCNAMASLRSDSCAAYQQLSGGAMFDTVTTVLHYNQTGIESIGHDIALEHV